MPDPARPRKGVRHWIGRGAGVTLVALFAVFLVRQCLDRATLRPGMGGLRVHLTGGRAVRHATVRFRSGRGTPGSTAAIVRETSTRDTLFVDVPPQFYEVVAYTDDGRGGFYETLGGNGSVRVEAGQVADIDVPLREGIAVTGRVLDAVTNQPLDHVTVTPPHRVGSVTWPVELPGLWTETRADGTFTLGGIEPYAPVTPGASPEPRQRASLSFARDGYAEQRIILDTRDEPTRHLEVRLERAPPPAL